MLQKCAYQYRFYPTKEQQQILARTFGCVRYVYNWALRLRMDTYKAEKRSLSTSQLSKRLTALKQQREQAFLNDVSSVPLQQSLHHLADAFTNFFEGRASYPKFKARHGKQSAEYTKSAFTWDGKVLRLAKMEDSLDIRWSRPLPEGVVPTTVTVSKDTVGRYFVSIRVEEDIAQPSPVNKVVGLDLGLKSMVVTSDGEAIGNPNSSHATKRNWRGHNVGCARRRRGRAIGRRPRHRWPVFTQGLLIVVAITNTNSRAASFARTKRFASRACASRTWSRTTRWPSPSMMWVGGSSSASWSTKRPGTADGFSRSTRSFRLPNAALIVAMSLMIFPLMCASGPAPSVASITIATSMPQTTFWPRDSRWLPVERL